MSERTNIFDVISLHFFYLLYFFKFSIIISSLRKRKQVSQTYIHINMLLVQKKVVVHTLLSTNWSRFVAQLFLDCFAKDYMPLFITTLAWQTFFSCKYWLSIFRGKWHFCPVKTGYLTDRVSHIEVIDTVFYSQLIIWWEYP